jgi:Rad3-related DNA helicase
MLGIGRDNFTFHEYPSDFDPARCPTYHIPTMRVDHRAKDLSMLYLRVDQIMARRADRKGIIQTISWPRRDETREFSHYADRMLVNQKGQSVTAAIEAFKASPPPYVFVSPSVDTGYDFPLDTCEYQIILKVPFPDSRFKIVRARQEDDPDYGPYQAMQSLVQMLGRPMRSKEDRAENFILDSHIQWFRPKFGHFAPRNFHQFFKTVDIVPAPPPKL